MKTTIILFFFILSQSILLHAENPNCEFYFNNQVRDSNLFVRFYPIGAIYHAEISLFSKVERYTLRSQKYKPGVLELTGIIRKGESDPAANKIRYLVGLDGYALTHRSYYPGYFEVDPDTTGIHFENWLLLGNDASANDGLDGLFGYGKYMFEIYKTTDGGYSFEQVVQIPIDWLDFNYPYDGFSNASEDLTLKIYSISPLNITFQWTSNVHGDEIPLFGTGSPPYEGEIKVYKQYHGKDDAGNWVGYNLNNENPPSKGASSADIYFLNYPIDGRNLPSPDTIPQHINPGNLKGNVLIDTNITTPETLNDNPTNIIMTNQTSMFIGSGRTFNMVTASSPTNGVTNLIIDTLSLLSPLSNAKIYINNHNKLTLRKNSSVKFYPGSEIHISPGGLFCNEGANIVGPGRIIYTNGLHQIMCNQLADYKLKDSVKFVLADSAVVEIPDSTTLHLSGKTTSLILGYNSKLKFGVGSRILIDSGANLIANNSEFSSVDSTKQWLGIALQGISQDTIKNCVIKNAYYGISISGKTDADTNQIHSTEISGCSFINQTSSILNDGIYVYNSNNILLMDNTISSDILTLGYTFGIYAEYCPTGNFNIIGNDIDNSTAGLTIIQTSPYIARNTLNGNSAGDNGMFLDNSNGTIL
jgi:hypothetical protein